MYRLLIGCLLTMALSSHSLSLYAEEPAPEYFSHSEVLLHYSQNRKPAESDQLKLVWEHFSKWKYGDNLLVVDLLGKPDLSTDIDMYYFKYVTRVSLDKTLNRKILPSNHLGELYLTAQYVDTNYDNRTWLYGVSIDFAGHPNHGHSQLDLLVRQEKTQKTSFYALYFWIQPFRMVNLDWLAKGFVEYWQDDHKDIFVTKPQLRLPLNNFVDKDNLFFNASVGLQVDIVNNLPSEDRSWDVSPMLYISFDL
jgi:hypothetical protein